MTNDDFFKLNIGQKIWYKNQAYEIKALTRVNDSTGFKLNNYVHFYCDYNYHWDNICEQCSLEETITPLPCPFCGEDKRIDCVDHGAYFYCLCDQDNCCAEGPPKDSKDEAIKAWNKRV